MEEIFQAARKPGWQLDRYIDKAGKLKRKFASQIVKRIDRGSRRSRQMDKERERQIDREREGERDRQQAEHDCVGC